MTSSGPQSTSRVGILPLGEVPDVVLEVLSRRILGSLHLSSVALPPSPLPPEAFNGALGQYDAAKVIKTMNGIPAPGCEKVIGVLHADLFIPIFAYVLGEAVQGGRCGVVSLHRLGEGPPGEPSLTAVSLERAAKAALHEIGHLYGLVHCMEAQCLMRFSGGVKELDQTPLFLCKYCEVYLQDALRKGRHE